MTSGQVTTSSRQHTNAAAAGTPPEAPMSRAGHSSYTTTSRYIDLAGERFRGEAERLESRLWRASGTTNRPNCRFTVLDVAAETPDRLIPSGGGGIRTDEA